MIFPKTFHIALGSNKGDKFKNLQDAIDAIYQRIGVIQNISPIYQTPALGFSSDDFYNCCIALTTRLKPQEVLDILLEIECVLGRVRTTVGVYESRVIDLDIILVEDAVITTQTLQIPHPEMQHRKFVLVPLTAIAPKGIHPLLQKNNTELLDLCKDNSVIMETSHQLVNPAAGYDFSTYNYVAIEGNIGAGKTCLATKIAQDFNAKLILERFAENPFLPKFYEDNSRYALPLEMSFLADRYQQISEDVSQLDLFKNFVVSDYYVFKSLIFSKVTLNTEEFKLYRTLFDIMFKDLVKPKLYVYLHQNTARLQENIKKRGRGYEAHITNAYLEKINEGYLSFLKTQKDLNVKIIDISNRDFVAHREDYLWLLDAIFRVNT
jgi:2-amino-4-hydroxy-6-hydroxymethyldihydropteridine diphosphokinase